MASDSKLPIAIFAALVAIIAIPFVIDQIRDRRRPVLTDARIVTATSSDPVYREGRRHVPPGDRVDVALALRLERWGGTDEWLSPAARLEVDGTEIPHLQTAQWPDHDRMLRVFWFSVECSSLGGALTVETAAESLRYHTFLAPEMGRGLQALVLPETHNDDYIAQTGDGPPEGAGTIRLYARIEVVEESDDVGSLQSVATVDLEQFLDPGFPTLLLAADLGEDIDASAAELFRLPGFQPQGDTPEARNAVTDDAFGRSFDQLVSDRVAVSSWTLAATAVSGRADLDPSALERLGEVTVGGDPLRAGRRPLVWGDTVHPGDLLADGDHWFVLLGDNGDGVLDPSDSVLHSWGRPPERTTLFAAGGMDGTKLEHRRLSR
jgi:hypothetical protein